MRISTFNPLKTKTGDSLWLLITDPNYTKDPVKLTYASFNLKFIKVKVMEKQERLDTSNNLLCVRKFKFVVKTTSLLQDGLDVLNCDEQSLLFNTLQELKGFVFAQTSQLFTKTLDHEQRQKDYRKTKLIDKVIV